MQPCSPELIHNCLSRWEVFLELSLHVRSNSKRSIVTALHSINAQLFSKSENVLPRHTELVADLLIRECWIGKHRAEPEECSPPVMAIEARDTHHLLDRS